MSARLRGIVPPLITPLDANQQLDVASLERLLEYVLAGGVHGVFVLGTTGEGPSLGESVQRDVIERTTRWVRGRVPVLVGVTDSAIEATHELTKIAADCGATAIVAAPPYYFPMAQRDVARYFVALADESPLPLFVYNIPPCAHNAIDLSTYEACVQSPNICGIKDSSGDLDLFARLIPLKQARPDWSILMGPESLTAQATLMGGDGGVNGGANVAPRLFVDLFDAANSGDRERITRLQTNVVQFGKIYDAGDDFARFVRSTKCAASLLGLCSDRMAPPFEEYDEAARGEIARVLSQLGLPIHDDVLV